jgi:hypothetical protein
MEQERESSIGDIHTPFGTKVYNRFKNVNFKEIKVGDTIQIFPEYDVVDVVVKTTNVYDTLCEVFERINKKFKRSDCFYSYHNKNNLIQFVYILIGRFFDTNTRKQLVDKFESDQEMNFLELLGDACFFEGIYKIRDGVWGI